MTATAIHPAPRIHFGCEVRLQSFGLAGLAVITAGVLTFTSAYQPPAPVLSPQRVSLSPNFDYGGGGSAMYVDRVFEGRVNTTRGAALVEAETFTFKR